ncbi:hypothetical protein KIPE111705_23760 [Kibdelosporangium persicum]|uniref:Uncharacterized protein n=2 Tax=Kibdelosporangium persicum TaxID=2698649 RepID=A0ABX2F3B7_9PSEU|nr:hypothetical protein [Kibdelosporangium persicum]
MGFAALTVAAVPAQALGPGVVCMFNAPTGAPVGPARMGHVGWAFRIGDSQSWNFGATESASYNWRDSGDLNTMFDTFRGLRGKGITRGYYTQWRCKDTPNSSVGAASNKVSQLYGQSYDALWNNCLTRSVAIFKAYDSSVSNLPSGGATGPNYYFDNLTYGFGPKHPL